MCAAPVPESPERSRTKITPIQWVGLAVLVLLAAYQFGFFRFDSPGAMSGFVVNQLPRFVGLVLAITVHEFSHGFIATRFGDGTPRRAGRLTLNPLKHLDPLGTIMILVGPIGWGRPMPINPGEMRHPNLGWALSSLAGPLSNVLSATIAAIIFGLFSSDFDRTTSTFFYAFMLINVGLAVFNLLPVPPLDGFGFVFGLAPTPVKVALLPLQQYGPLILLAVLFLPPLRPIVDNFIAAGYGVIVPQLEELCQCNLIG